MKILITADLHYREQWFRLLSRAAEWDLVCIAGDLLDMFNAEPRIMQARTVSRWIRELAKVTRVAICSGNHHNSGRQISADRDAGKGRRLYDVRASQSVPLATGDNKPLAGET